MEMEVGGDRVMARLGGGRHGLYETTIVRKPISK